LRDVIFKPFLFINQGDRKISELYSINLRQYAITKSGYEFLEKMKRNTEQIGSIFDAQPSQLQGNIHCVTDENEPVVGYINVCSVEEKRLFIKSSDVPLWNFNTKCEEWSIPNIKDSILDAIQTGNLPTDGLIYAGPAIVRFGVTTVDCINCTLSGTNVKPAFWPR
jgi:hypothetical protein